MKPPAPTNPSPETGTSLLDWPRASGLSEEFLTRVSVHVKRRRRRRVSAKAGLAGAVVLAALLWFVPYLRERRTDTTAPAHRGTIHLTDGSRVDLNADTKLRTDFRGQRRAATLDHGEAFFSVASDPAHPFRVETPSGVVQVLGTQFNVRLTPEGGVEVTLFEGAVAIEGLATTRLAPGEQFASQHGSVRALTSDQLEHVIAWRRGVLAFDGLTLAKAISRISSYHGATITLASEVMDLQPAGEFSIEDLPALLQALEKALPIRVLSPGNGSYRIVAR